MPKAIERYDFKNTPALARTRFQDARRMEDVEDGQAQLVIVTPPFLSCKTRGGRQSDRMFLSELLAECRRIVSPRGVIAVINTDPKCGGTVYPRHSVILVEAEKLGLWLKDQKIWVRRFKRNLYRKTFSHIQIFGAGRGVFQFRNAEYEKDSWVYTKSQIFSGFRDALAPEVAAILIQNFTLPHVHLVVSACSGTGTVLILAHRAKRLAIGYEINPGMAELISRREETIDSFWTDGEEIDLVRDLEFPRKFALSFMVIPDDRLTDIVAGSMAQEETAEVHWCGSGVCDDDIQLHAFNATEDEEVRLAAEEFISALEERHASSSVTVVPLALYHVKTMRVLKVYDAPKYQAKLDAAALELGLKLETARGTKAPLC